VRESGILIDVREVIFVVRNLHFGLALRLDK